MPVYSPAQLEELKRSFAEKGYLVFKAVVPKPPLAQLAAAIAAEFDRVRDNGLFAGGGSISGHLNCAPGEGARFAYQALEERGILEVVRAIYPKPFDRPYVGCNFNMPGSVEQHYHMDGWFTGDFIIANVAVVDTGLVNGAIDVIPGTHQRFYKFWQYALARAWRRSTRLTMEQGDVLVRTSTLWHRGMPNRSATPRPMVAFTFGDPGSAPPPDPFKAHDGKITFLPNWYRPTLLGRLRERTFVAAPVTYSAWRFARSLIGNKGYDG